jgi:hypothetical protein
MSPWKLVSFSRRAAVQSRVFGGGAREEEMLPIKEDAREKASEYGSAG